MKKQDKLTTLPVLIEQDENGLYIGSVPSLRSCYTQADTLEELYINLNEVVNLCMETEKKFFHRNVIASKIIGFQNLQFKVS